MRPFMTPDLPGTPQCPASSTQRARCRSERETRIATGPRIDPLITVAEGRFRAGGASAMISRAQGTLRVVLSALSGWRPRRLLPDYGSVKTNSALGAPGARPPPTGTARYCLPLTA